MLHCWNVELYNAKLTLIQATKKTTPHSWYLYVVANVSQYANNCNMNVNSVEKHCIVVLNAKSQSKSWFRTLYWLSELFYTGSTLKTIIATGCLAENLCICYPGNNHVIYWPELNF